MTKCYWCQSYGIVVRPGSGIPICKNHKEMMTWGDINKAISEASKPYDYWWPYSELWEY